MKVYLVEEHHRELENEQLGIATSLEGAVKIILTYDALEPVGTRVPILVREYEADCPKLDFEYSGEWTFDYDKAELVRI